MTYIVFDLEWNQAAKKGLENPDLSFEIIEIGAVKMNEQGQIFDEFSCLIRPVIYPELYSRIREVVRIPRQELERGIDFVTAYEQFITWCGEEYIFCTWGTMDLTELQHNIEFYNLPNPFPKPLYYYDVQKLYSLYYEDGKSRRALDHTIRELGYRTSEPYHRAMSDAFYTAMVLATIDMEKMGQFVSVDYFHEPQTKEDEVYLVFDEYSKFVSREFESKETAMQDAQVASMVCFRCGNNVKRVLPWFSDNGRFYLGLAACPKHGYLKGKIRVKKAHDGEGIFMVKTQRFVSEEEAEKVRDRNNELREKRRIKRKNA